MWYRGILTAGLLALCFFTGAARGVDDISPMAIYNVGLVGCDTCGVAVLNHFLSTGEARCVAVWSPDEAWSRAVKEEVAPLQSKVPEVCADYADMLDRRDLDIVLIVLPEAQGLPLFLQACDYDKSIYIELPIHLSAEEIAPLVEASHATAGVAQVGCHATDPGETAGRVENMLSYLNGQTDSLSSPIDKISVSDK